MRFTRGVMSPCMSHHPIAARDFRRATLAALAKKGITIVSATTVPGVDGSFANGDRGYGLDDNGTFRLVLFLQVLAIAKA